MKIQTGRGKTSKVKRTAVQRCSICPATNGVMKNRRCGWAPMCPTCAQKILRYTRVSEARADERSHEIIASLMCMVIARRGYKKGSIVAFKLLGILAP